MYICICSAVTEKEIRQAAREGVGSLPELTARTGCSGTCGACTDSALEVLEQELRHDRSTFIPLPSVQFA